MGSAYIKQEFLGKNPNGITLTDEQYIALLDMGEVVLLFNPRTTLLVDIPKEKLEKYEVSGNTEIIVEAKTPAYANKFGIDGLFYVVGYTYRNNIVTLDLIEVGNPGEIRRIFPSRLRVHSITEKE